MSHTPVSAAVIEADSFLVRRTLTISAPVPAVWAAVTEPAHLSRWFGDTILSGTHAGATGTISWPDSGAHPLRLEAIDPQHSVSYRWSGDDSAPVPTELDDAHSTVFTFTLVPVGEGTELTVVETGFETTSDPSANLESHRQGWNSELDELVELVEGAGAIHA